MTFLVLLALATFPVHPMVGRGGSAPRCRVQHCVFGLERGARYTVTCDGDTVGVHLEAGPVGDLCFCAPLSSPIVVRREQ